MKQTILICLLFCSTYLFAQDSANTSCGQKKATENLFSRNPELRTLHEQIEARLYEYNRTKKQRSGEDQRTNAVVSLPVVVHIIHNNGPENISNAQAQTAIQHLNEAFANTGYYNPADGVNTEIQFCLAKRDPAGNATNGIDRVVSPLTVMNGWEDYSVDLAVKNLSRWDPRCYINIWVVGDITGGVAGYAYLPSAHGSNVDGIVLEARYFGTSNANDVVVIHEMGHYLGLYHTFEGGCGNTDCATSGDRVCDTPPDQSTVAISCNSSVNSCTTDALSGFSTDQNDLTQDYMDYGNWNCMKVFTQGQADRMNWYIQNVRRSLLNCRSCQDPCPAPVVANFTSSANNISIGTLVNFTNSSSNATGYRWYINGVLQSTATNYSYTFNSAGTFVIKLTATSGNALCDSTFKYDTVRVTCPVTAGFSPLSTNENTNVTVNFTNSSTGATSYAWYVNGTLQSTGLNFSYAFTAAGNYVIKLKAMNGTCADSLGGTVVITDTCLRQTFQKTYGGPGDDVAYDVRSTTDGGYIMAGKTNSFGAGAYDGYVVKMDNQGIVEWSRVYGGSRDDYINRILQTSDGGYVMVGQTKSYNNPNGDAWVIKTDGAGAIQWTKRYGENSTFGELGIIICTTSDGGYAFVGSQNGAPGTSNVLVVKLDANGNVQWSRVYDSGNTDGGGGTIMEDNGILFVTAFTRTSFSYHDGLVMKILMSNGNLQWMRRYEVDGRNNFGGELFKVGNGYKFHLPSIQDFSNLNTGRNITLSLDANGVVTGVRQLVPPDYGNGPILIMPDGSEIAVYNEQNTTSEFNIMKVSSNNSIQWAKKYVRPGPQVNYVIRHSQDGGFITIGASNPSTNNDIYVAKVDLLGNSPGCDTARINVAVQSPPFASDLFNWASQRPASFTNPLDITVSNNPVNTSASALCTGSTCVDTVQVDTCNGYSFLKHIGRNGSSAGYDVKKTPDGGMIIAGETSAPGGQPDAILTRTDAKGNIIWSKTFGTTGMDAFYTFIPTSDGNYLAAGYGRFNASHRTDAFFLKFDINGNVIWMKSYGSGTTFGERAVSVKQTDDGGYVSALTYNHDPAVVQPMYLRLDANGNLLWSKLLGVNNAGDVSDVLVQGDVIYGAGTTSRSGNTYNDAYLTKFRLSDGAVLWNRRLESQNRSNRFERMWLVNGQLQFTMFNFDVWTTGNFTPIIVKSDTSGNISYSRSFEVQGINRTTVNPGVIPTSDGGFVAALAELTPNASPRLVKIAANGAVTWANTYGAPYQSQVLYRVIEDAEGYLSVGAGTKTGGTQNILLLRATHAGTLAGTGTGQNCPVTGSAAVDNNIVIQSIPQGASYWNISSGNLQSQTGNLAVVDIALTVETPCIDTADCNPPPPVDTCNDVTYIKNYATSDSSESFNAAVPTPDNYLLIGGHTISSTMNGVLIKMKKDGTIVWQKKFDVTTITQVLITSDNNYLIGGLTNGGTFLIKIDPAGNAVWKSQISNLNGYSFSKVIQGSDNNYYTIGPRQLGYVGDYHVSKISPLGAVIWTKLFAPPSSVELYPYDILDDGTTVVIAGRYLPTSGSSGPWGFITKLNKTDGSVVYSNSYHTNGRVIFTQINKAGSDYLLTGYTQGSPTFISFYKVNAAGNILRVRSFFGYGVNDFNNTFVTPSGEIISTSRYGTFNPTEPRVLSMYKLDANWNPVWMKRYSQFPITFQGQNVFQSGTNIYLAGSTHGNVRAIGILNRFTQHGELLSCPSDTFNLWISDVLPVNFTVTPFTHPNITNISLTVNNTPATVSTFNAALVETRCYGTVAKCDSLDISGEDTVCNLIDTLHFRATRDSTCATAVQWSIDTAYGKIISYTDTTIDIKFKRTGTVYLYGTIITPCSIIRDSILVSIFDFPDTVNLGPDRQLCAISVITLNAGGGFASYRWNTGSMDSTITVDQPGTYSVEAFDLCGNAVRDTVVIAVAAPIPFDLGPDLTICSKDTLTITAPLGFTRYTWADNYNISSRYTQSVSVWPSADTTYSVIAETTLGCLVYDSIRVTVKIAPPIDIGADTSFCQNDSANISATPGFNDYTWNTGATTQQITVKNKGIYIVRATAPNGCISKDTMEVRNVFGLPIVNIGKDTIICKDNTHTFDAGTHASYLWHDGSTGRSFTATQVGQVWVRVISDSGCVSSDTAHILRIAAPPQNFLDTAAEFCPYEKAMLSAKGIFARYRWSTGSVSPTIETNIPGTYWLEVTNTDGCTNREYINVKTKICRIAIDFPNAFTPNNDRTNDTYKPIVRGTLIGYKFTIYNRWGQAVFETTNSSKAWDGTVGGKPQDSGAFVWICKYQFAGEEMKVAKGTLLLIK